MLYACLMFAQSCKHPITLTCAVGSNAPVSSAFALSSAGVSGHLKLVHSVRLQTTYQRLCTRAVINVQQFLGMFQRLAGTTHRHVVNSIAPYHACVKIQLICSKWYKKPSCR